MSITLSNKDPLSFYELMACLDLLQNIADDQDAPSDTRKACDLAAKAIEKEIARLKDDQA